MVGVGGISSTCNHESLGLCLLLRLYTKPLNQSRIGMAQGDIKVPPLFLSFRFSSYPLLGQLRTFLAILHVQRQCGIPISHSSPLGGHVEKFNVLKTRHDCGYEISPVLFALIYSQEVDCSLCLSSWNHYNSPTWQVSGSERSVKWGRKRQNDGAI